MPTLDWIGKDKVINHHKDVPYKVVLCQDLVQVKTRNFSPF